MKNEFIKNKNNVVKSNNAKSKKKVNFIAFFIIIIVSLCSIFSCVFSFLNYLNSYSVNKVYADELDEDLPVSQSMPSDYPNLFFAGSTVTTSYYSFSSLDSYSLSFNVTGINMTVRTNIYNISMPLDFLRGVNYTFYISDVIFPSFVSECRVLCAGTYFLTGGLYTHIPYSDYNDQTLTLQVFYDNVDEFTPFNFVITFGVWEGDFSISDFSDSVYYQIGQLSGFNEGYNSGYEYGYSKGFDLGSNTANSLGLFASASFKYKYFYSGEEPDWSNNLFDYSTWTVLDPLYFTPYYNGFYFNSLTAMDLGDIAEDEDSCDIQKGYVVADFGISGADISRYAVWQVCAFMGDSLNITGDFGSAVGFRFVDGTYLLFNNSDDYFSTIYLDESYTSLRLRSIEFISITDHFFFGLMSSRDFQDVYARAYNDGLNTGIHQGTSEGYNSGYSVGYNVGYNKGISNATNYTFLSLIGAVVDVPIRAFSSLLNFNLLGFNMLGFFLGLLTLGIILWVIKLILGKK